jgi:hypothetical protein
MWLANPVPYTEASIPVSWDSYLLLLGQEGRKGESLEVWDGIWSLALSQHQVPHEVPDAPSNHRMVLWALAASGGRCSDASHGGRIGCLC